MKHVIDSDFLSLLEARELRVGKAFAGFFGGNRKSRDNGSSPEFSDYREYAPGDDLRRIDWNLYGRFEKLYLKLFVDERQLHHRIYLDASASMDWGEEKKSHMAMKIAAALGFLSVKALDRVSFYALHESEILPIGQTVVGKDAFYRTVEELEALPFEGEVSMDAAFSSAENHGGRNGISVILSDFFSEEDWKGAVDRLVAEGRQVVLIQVLSREEIDPGYSGKVMLLDAEGQGEEDPRNFRMDISRSSLAAYRKALEYHQGCIRDFCAARGVDFITVCSDEKPEEILFQKAMEVGLIL